MNSSGKKVLDRFFTSLANRDADAMNACYNPEIIYMDPIIGVLKSTDVFAMWEMITEDTPDFSVSYNEPEDRGDGYWICQWRFSYRYPETNRKVINDIKAFMKVEDGKITEHSDAYSFLAWTKKAYGLKGWLLGRSGFFRKKMRTSSMKRLSDYINSHYH